MQDIREYTTLQKIKDYIDKIFKTSFVINLSITFFENVITKGLNFLIILFLIRLLGPDDYGKYSFIFVVMAFCSAFFDFGMENTAVRFSAREKTLCNSIFGLYFIVKIAILIIITALIALYGNFAFNLAQKSHVVQYIPYLIIGLIGESLFFINDTYLQAVQKFKLRAIINISRYSLSLLFVVLLYLKKVLLLKFVFFVYLIPLAFSILFIKKYFCFLNSFIKQKLDNSLIKEILSYEKWMFVLSMANNSLGRIDFLMISLWASYAQLGIYNAAFQLASVVSFLPLVLGKVMLPKLAELKDAEIITETEKIFKVATKISLSAIILLPLFSMLIPSLLGKEYQSAVQIFQIMMVSFLLSMITLPFDQALYAIGKPKYSAFIRISQILIIVVLNILLVPAYGIIWAAISVLIARLIAFAITKFVFIQEKKLLNEGIYDISRPNLSY